MRNLALAKKRNANYRAGQGDSGTGNSGSYFTVDGKLAVSIAYYKQPTKGLL